MDCKRSRVNLMPSPSHLLLQGIAGMSYDPDAAAYFTATGITDLAVKAAINSFVIGLKADSLWAKMLALYPMPGNTGTINKYNLKSPVDADANYRLTYGANVTHGSTGINSNGSGGAPNAVDTHFNPSTQLASNDCSFGVINHTDPNVNNATGGNWFGVIGTGSTNCPRFTRGANAAELIVGMGGNSRTISGISLTQFIAVSNSGIAAQPYIDGVATGLAVVTNTMTRPNFNVNLLRYNANGSIQGTCNFIMKFAFIGLVLTAGDMANMNTRAHALQTALGR